MRKLLKYLRPTLGILAGLAVIGCAMSLSSCGVWAGTVDGEDLANRGIGLAGSIASGNYTGAIGQGLDILLILTGLKVTTKIPAMARATGRATKTLIKAPKAIRDLVAGDQPIQPPTSPA